MDSKHFSSNYHSHRQLHYDRMIDPTINNSCLNWSDASLESHSRCRQNNLTALSLSSPSNVHCRRFTTLVLFPSMTYIPDISSVRRQTMTLVSPSRRKRNRRGSKKNIVVSLTLARCQREEKKEHGRTNPNFTMVDDFQFAQNLKYVLSIVDGFAQLFFDEPLDRFRRVKTVVE